MMKGPLLLGADLTALNQEQIKLLQNQYLLAFNQDAVVGSPAAPYKWGINPDWTFDSVTPAMFWSGASSVGVMVALMNPTGETRSMSAVFGEVPQLQGDAGYHTVDVWTGEDLGCVRGNLDRDVASHDTAVFLFGEQC